MRSQRRELTTIRFHGPSFEDHGLELGVLPELVQYKRILIETAKELWRVNHPERERIPKGLQVSKALYPVFTVLTKDGASLIAHRS